MYVLKQCFERVEKNVGKNLVEMHLELDFKGEVSLCYLRVSRRSRGREEGVVRARRRDLTGDTLTKRRGWSVRSRQGTVEMRLARRAEARL